jgi:hypothetical protein
MKQFFDRVLLISWPNSKLIRHIPHEIGILTQINKQIDKIKRYFKEKFLVAVKFVFKEK